MDEYFCVDGHRVGKYHTADNFPAGSVIVAESHDELYYVKFSRGFMYHPWAVRRRTYDNNSMRKVKKDVYDTYIQFLTTKNEAHLKRAEREAING